MRIHDKQHILAVLNQAHGLALVSYSLFRDPRDGSTWVAFGFAVMSDIYCQHDMDCDIGVFVSTNNGELELYPDLEPNHNDIMGFSRYVKLSGVKEEIWTAFETATDDFSHLFTDCAYRFYRRWLQQSMRTWKDHIKLSSHHLCH